MRRYFLPIFLAFSLVAMAQTPEKEPSVEELAAKEAERLENLLNLEAWQVFYVDSTLQHDYKALQEELRDMQQAKVENYDLYMIVRDKWAERIDSSYHRFFSEQQWTKYMKSGAARAKKARDKRKAKAGK